MKKIKFTALLLAAAMFSGAYAQNLIEDSSFEKGVSNWIPSNWKRGDDKIWLAPSWDKSNSQGAGGTASMKLEWTSKHIAYIWYKDALPLNGMQEVELSFWAKNVGYDKTNIIEINVTFPDVKDAKLKTVTIGNPWNRLPTDWTYFKKKIKVPAGATKAKLYIRINGFKSTKGTSWIDNVYFGPVCQGETGECPKK